MQNTFIIFSIVFIWRKIMNQDAKIGQRLKYFRELKGVTQYEMADFANISKNYISALERDKNNPSIQVVFAYCQKLNITPNEIAST